MHHRVLSQRQRNYISKVVRDVHLALMVDLLGPDSIDQEDYDRLVAEGKRLNNKPSSDVVSYVHSIGLVEAKENYQGIVEAEHEVLTVIRDRLAVYISEMSNKLNTDISHALVSAEAAALRDNINYASAKRSSVEPITSKLRSLAVDLKRNWFRIVQTEVHNAVEDVKSSVFSQHADPRVFKRTRADSCAFCKMLYLKPDGVMPRVFRLSDLRANGTNVGRRAGQPTRSGRSRTQWKAVVGATHPLCGCELTFLHDGAGFNTRGEVVHVGLEKSASIEIDSFDRELSNHNCEV